ncbi:uroporphyrinogen-III C-methyltransferase [Siminovitchia sp. 179-K 8D1 HS]|uniref:uroporphyrinogen-III C-methyltransferase n=1 Tax=Siminovitchia sp. 179-K 8D1 HS TaxID=3142385 RepID=UPI0039A3CDCF
MNKGKVFLVGAGPGDPKLLTVYGMECLQQADVIAYDRLVNPKLLELAKPDAELIFCGKLPGRHALIQEQINQMLVDKANDGKIVTRLKGGDPCVFGRAGEEAQILSEHGIDFEIVPGVTSGIAAPAYAGIPVTHRDHASSFAIVTGHGRAEKQQDHIHWKALAEGIDTIAFYMSVGNLTYICKQLIENGKNPDTPAALIEWGTMEKQRTVTGCLRNIAELGEQENIQHPAIFLVSETVQLREKIGWFEKKLQQEQVKEQPI